MQPMGRKPVRFPSKRDVHPTPPSVNWWEVEISADNKKKSDRQQAKKDIVVELLDVE